MLVLHNAAARVGHSVHSGRVLFNGSNYDRKLTLPTSPGAGARSSMVEHGAHNAKAAGSTPAVPKDYFWFGYCYAGLHPVISWQWVHVWCQHRTAAIKLIRMEVLLLFLKQAFSTIFVFCNAICL